MSNLKRLWFPTFAAITALILASSQVVMACDDDGKRPPNSLVNCEGEIDGFGPGIEIPSHIVATAGGVGDSIIPNPGPGDPIDPHIMSWTLGEPVSGTFEVDSCAGGEDNPCKLEVGYGFFEFYSDRVPLSNLSLTVNGGNIYTNTRDVLLEIDFSDDLSGFLSATMTERFSGEIRNLSTLGSTDIGWRLGGPNTPDDQVPDGDYNFDFVFNDRAGNVSSDRPTRSIRYDTIPPSTGTVVINNDDIFTSSLTVTLDLSSHDVGISSSRVAYVRISNSSTTPRSQWLMFPFVEPRMAIEWQLAQGEEGERWVFAQFRDSAGNWSTGIASDTIDVGVFSPSGTITVDDSSENINVLGQGFESRLHVVPLILGWDESQTGVIRTVIISGGPTEHEETIDNEDLPGKIVDYRIAADGEPDDDPDSPRIISAVFVDLAGNRSLPVSVSIVFNQNRPPPPSVAVETFVSSLTIRAEYLAPERDIRFYTFDNISQEVGQSSAVIHVEYSSQPVTFVDDELRPNTRYIYEVTSNDGFQDSNSGFPFDEEFYTQAREPAQANPPRGLEINVLGISWDTQDNPPGTLYRVQWSLAFNFPQDERTGDSGWMEYTAGTEFQVNGLEIGTEYFVRVKAQNALEVETDWVSLGSGFTESFRSPLPPTNLRAIAKSSTTITWKWDRTPSTEQGFILIDPINDRNEIDRILLDRSTPTYEYVEQDLTPNSIVIREVVAFNGFEGRETRTEAARSEPVFTLPVQPGALPMTVNASEITAHWDSNGNDEETEYEVQIDVNPEYTTVPESSGWIRATSFLFRGLQPRTEYFARVRARDRNPVEEEKDTTDWVPLGSMETETFDHGQQVDLGDVVVGWHLTVPPNALDQDYVVQLTGDPNQFQTTSIDVIQEATRKAKHETGGYRKPVPGGIIEVVLNSIDGSMIESSLSKQAILSYEFVDQAPKDGVVDQGFAAANEGRAEIPELTDPGDSNRQPRTKTLRLWFLDKETESWFRVPSNDIDTFLSQVQGGIQRIGVFAVMGAPDFEVNDVVSFPVPFRPNGPNSGIGAGQTGTEGGGITFGNLPQSGKIEIFDLRGHLVKEIMLTGAGLAQWNVRNQDGQKVVSGTYIWMATSGGNTKTGKLVVIR